MGSEKNLENRIKNFLKSKRIWYVKFHGTGFTKSGVPDLLTCINGKFVAIEVKSQIGKTTKLQDFHMQEIRNCGGIAMVVRPSNFEDFKLRIEELC